MPYRSPEVTQSLDMRLELGGKLHMAPGFRSLLLGEVHASELVGYDALRVPGQLQQLLYAQELAATATTPLDEHLQLRDLRVAHLKSEDAPRQTYFMGRWALEGDTPGMHEQREAILFRAGDNCRIRVIDEFDPALLSGGFTAFYEEGRLYEAVGEDPMGLHPYHDENTLRFTEGQVKAFDTLAMPHEQSLEFIDALQRAA